ncbi:hypothetical protein OROMI_019210 [Orobanche minor]
MQHIVPQVLILCKLLREGLCQDSCGKRALLAIQPLGVGRWLGLRVLQLGDAFFQELDLTRVVHWR